MKCQWGCPVCSGQITYREGPKQFTQGIIYCEYCYEPATHADVLNEYTECCGGEILGAAEARREYAEEREDETRAEPA